MDDTMHQDVCDILNALGLGDHARPKSYHEVIQTEILPAIEKLKLRVDKPSWD